MIVWLIWLGVFLTIVSSMIVAYAFTRKQISKDDVSDMHWVYFGGGLAIWIFAIILIFLGTKIGFGKGCPKCPTVNVARAVAAPK